VEKIYAGTATANGTLFIRVLLKTGLVRTGQNKWFAHVQGGRRC